MLVVRLNCELLIHNNKQALFASGRVYLIINRNEIDSYQIFGAWFYCLPTNPYLIDNQKRIQLHTLRFNLQDEIA